MKDPCVDYIKLERSEKRSTGYFVDWTSEDPISDDVLEEGWYSMYRVNSDNDDDMPTIPPGTKYCGTMNPVWLNGTKGFFFLYNKI